MARVATMKVVQKDWWGISRLANAVPDDMIDVAVIWIWWLFAGDARNISGLGQLRVGAGSE